MAKKNDSENKAPRNNKHQVTAERKARKILKSSGLNALKTWADKSFTGGANRKKASRSSMKSLSPSVYRDLVLKGEHLNRKMDR